MLYHTLAIGRPISVVGVNVNVRVRTSSKPVVMFQVVTNVSNMKYTPSTPVSSASKTTAATIVVWSVLAAINAA
jgi:hypothetical protein